MLFSLIVFLLNEIGQESRLCAADYYYFHKQREAAHQQFALISFHHFQWNIHCCPSVTLFILSSSTQNYDIAGSSIKNNALNLIGIVLLLILVKSLSLVVVDFYLFT